MPFYELTVCSAQDYVHVQCFFIKIMKVQVLSNFCYVYNNNSAAMYYKIFEPKHFILCHLIPTVL